MSESNSKNTQASCPALHQPASYFPLSDGRYRVSPGLFRFGTDFGNGDKDQHYFQIDSDFFDYRDNKLRARGERLGKYYCDELNEPPVLRRIHAHIIKRLSHEHPLLYELEIGSRAVGLHCHLTGEVLVFDKEYNFREALNSNYPSPVYQSGLDALACQLQEDIAVVTAAEAGDNRLAALHLCFPNHWAAEDKIGKSFDIIHQPVAGMAATNNKSAQIVSSMIRQSPYVRFAWGIATDRRLNHHPVAPKPQQQHWQGRRFTGSNESLYLRIERQTTNGFPDIDTALFTIRTYFTDIAQLKKSNPPQVRAIHDAISSMTDAQLRYKGLYQDKTRILKWLTGT